MVVVERAWTVRQVSQLTNRCPIQTANLDESAIASLPSSFRSGVYYGFAAVNDGEVYPMVMSVGRNPHFDNTKTSLEIHILHKFEQDFYGCRLKAVAIGFLRPMKSFDTLEELKNAIAEDIDKARSAVEKRTDMDRIGQLFSSH